MRRFLILIAQIFIHKQIHLSIFKEVIEFMKFSYSFIVLCNYSHCSFCFAKLFQVLRYQLYSLTLVPPENQTVRVKTFSLLCFSLNIDGWILYLKNTAASPDSLMIQMIGT